MLPDRRLPDKSKLVKPDKDPIPLGMEPARPPSDRSNSVTRPASTVTPGQESTIPLPQERNG